MNITLKSKLKRSINSSKKHVFLRSDFDRFGTYRQVSRALSDLQREGVLSRAGYGIYSKADEVQPDVDAMVGMIKHRLGRRINRVVQVSGVTVHLGYIDKIKNNAQVSLDNVKLRLAKEVVNRVPLSRVREVSLSNLDRWQSNGVWCSAYDEWSTLMRSGSNEDLLAVMTGTDEESNRLRQSPPYTGLLDQKTVKEIREAATA